MPCGAAGSRVSAGILNRMVPAPGVFRPSGSATLAPMPTDIRLITGDRLLVETPSFDELASSLAGGMWINVHRRKGGQIMLNPASVAYIEDQPRAGDAPAQA